MSPTKLYSSSFPLIILILIILVLSEIIAISHSQTIPQPCHPHDKTVLLRIKHELNNPSSLFSWHPNTDCCTHWNTLECNDQGRVVALTFNPSHEIHGPIPPYLDNLPYLTRLYFLNITNLSGPIPLYVRNLTNLTALVIMGTKVSGPIPDFLGLFSNLVQLNFPTNKFVGPIPESLGRLKNLLFLILSSNELTGPIPTALAQLTGLVGMDLSSNKFFGPIPDFLAQIPNLSTIILDSNSFSGPIPEYLGHMPTLTTLSLANNNLTGPIPKILGRSKIVILRLGNNKFIGNASFLFDNDTILFEIFVNNNYLKFDFSNVDLGRNIVTINISHNMIYGSLPKRFGQVLLDSFDVSYNQLCGPIPDGELFKGVDPTLFGNNTCLCGGPLPDCRLF